MLKCFNPFDMFLFKLETVLLTGRFVVSDAFPVNSIIVSSARYFEPVCNLRVSSTFAAHERGMGEICNGLPFTVSSRPVTPTERNLERALHPGRHTLPGTLRNQLPRPHLGRDREETRRPDELPRAGQGVSRRLDQADPNPHGRHRAVVHARHSFVQNLLRGIVGRLVSVTREIANQRGSSHSYSRSNPTDVEQVHDCDVSGTTAAFWKTTHDSAGVEIRAH